MKRFDERGVVDPEIEQPARLDGPLRMNVSFLERILGDDQIVVSTDGGCRGLVGGKTAVDQADLSVGALGVLDEALVERVRVEGAQERVDVDAGDAGTRAARSRRWPIVP